MIPLDIQRQILAKDFDKRYEVLAYKPRKGPKRLCVLLSEEKDRLISIGVAEWTTQRQIQIAFVNPHNCRIQRSWINANNLTTP